MSPLLYRAHLADGTVKRVLGASRAPEALAGHLAARTAAEAAAARLHSAEAAVAAAHADLRAWGVGALLAAVVAWEATGRQREAA